MLICYDATGGRSTAIRTGSNEQLFAFTANTLRDMASKEDDGESNLLRSEWWHWLWQACWIEADAIARD